MTLSPLGKTAFAVGWLVLGLAVIAAGPTTPDPIYAYIGNEAIHTSEINQAMEQLPPQARLQLQADPEAMKTFSDVFLSRRLVLDDARATGLDRSDTFVKQMNLLRNESLLQFYLDQLKADVAVPTEAEARAFYDANPNDFMTPAGVECEIIQVADKATAAAVLKKLKKGESFAKVRAAQSMSRETSVFLASELLAQDTQLRTLVGKLKAKQLAAAPYSGDGGTFFILKKTRDVTPTVVPFDRVRLQLMQKLYEDRANVVIQAKIEALKQARPIKIVEQP